MPIRSSAPEGNGPRETGTEAKLASREVSTEAKLASREVSTDAKLQADEVLGVEPDPARCVRRRRVIRAIIEI